ncbi:SGNH/GDSL hydrolase family protein [Flavihumibacter petaseus]|uniref:Hydrolase n=1 Tax=Flavihumibacter petaseus NBRC 106054 TaxID=1220578 RepID=A0A0E9N3Y6_9BACT|nr:SGNH/GDSL hydrolase family protein [Flavihumibacter petaseus]GAO44080.1 hypothetical protein FPE01S_03_01200 [Flavihumibacter petaseus NBRC 106054]
MKQWYVTPLFLLFLLPGLAQVRFYDAVDFPLLGKINDSTETRYERLPASLKGISRQPVWELGKNTSGLALRFRTNSTSIAAKWKVLNDYSMNHMTATGIKGLDLYAWTNGKWQFVNSARPGGKSNQQTIISHMAAGEREYLLYLPLYDGVVGLQVGVDSTAFIGKPLLQLPSTQNPVVCYGTSITQGGCATRPGMSYTSILERKLNREVINLGFSGNGRLDYEIAELMARRTDAGLFILDFIPNVTLEEVQGRTATFIRKLRAHNPEIPILMVESIIFPHSLFDQQMFNTVTDKNKALRKEYELLRKTDRNIYYLSAATLIGTDGEPTVDGIHLTDLGFLRFSDALQQVVRRIIR